MQKILFFALRFGLFDMFALINGNTFRYLKDFLNSMRKCLSKYILFLLTLLAREKILTAPGIIVFEKKK